MKVGGVDDVTHCFDALYKFAEIGNHVFSFNYLGIARKCRWKESLVNKGLKAHHDGVVCKIHKTNNTLNINCESTSCLVKTFFLCSILLGLFKFDSQKHLQCQICDSLG